jgi:serine/threonine protein kinase
LRNKISEALEAVHEKGIIHRDLKPANIKITPDDRVKVLDFGLAKMPDASSSGPIALSNSPTLMSQTVPGVILGTAAYMSPEQARGKAVDRRTDIWAFGCVLFEMLTGQPAFPGEDVVHILAVVVSGQPDWTALPASVPKSVRAVLRRCLEKTPSRRLRDIGDVWIEIEDLEQARAERVPRSRAWQMATGLMVLLILLIGYGYFKRAPDPPKPIQLNFHNYPLLRATEMPEIRVHFVCATDDPIVGIGEEALGWVCPVCVQRYFCHHWEEDSFAAPQESQPRLGHCLTGMAVLAALTMTHNY